MSGGLRSRTKVRSVPCPACGAAPGDRCTRDDGTERTSNHAERVAAYREMDRDRAASRRAVPPSSAPDRDDPFVAVRGKRMGELDGRGLLLARELWLRENVDWMGSYHADNYRALFAVIDGLRAAKPSPPPAAAPADSLAFQYRREQVAKQMAGVYSASAPAPPPADCAEQSSDEAAIRVVVVAGSHSRLTDYVRHRGWLEAGRIDRTPCILEDLPKRVLLLTPFDNVKGLSMVRRISGAVLHLLPGWYGPRFLGRPSAEPLAELLADLGGADRFLRVDDISRQ